MDSSILKALLDETGQSHIYEQTNVLEDVNHPIRQQVRNWNCCSMEQYFVCIVLPLLLNFTFYSWRS